MKREHITYPTPQLMADAVANRMLLLVNDMLCEPDRERVDVALTGGTDGTAILQAIAGSSLLPIVDWSRVHFWWGDERFVPADSNERNAVGAYDALLSQLLEKGLALPTQIHQMPADSRSPEQIAKAGDAENEMLVNKAAEQYQQELVRELGENPKLDLALFGIGPDGHFASLFPDYPQVLIDGEHSLTAGVTNSPKLPPLRVTLTVPMITRSDYVWICGSRSKKAEAIGLTWHEHDNPHLPASFADAVKQVLWITDIDGGKNC